MFKMFSSFPLDHPDDGHPSSMPSFHSDQVGDANFHRDAGVKEQHRCLNSLALKGAR